MISFNAPRNKSDPYPENRPLSLCHRSRIAPPEVRASRRSTTMRRYLLPLLACSAVAACTPTAGTERVTAGESVDIASAGAQLSVQRAQNGVHHVRWATVRRFRRRPKPDAQYLSRTALQPYRVRRLLGHESCPSRGISAMPRGREHRARAARYPHPAVRLDGQPRPSVEHPEPAADAIRFTRRRDRSGCWCSRGPC